PLGGKVDERLDNYDSPRYRLVAVFGENLRRYPISRELGRYLSILLRAEPLSSPSRRAIHRFRRATEPWSRAALAYAGDRCFEAELEEALAVPSEPPLLRGDELGIAPGPEIGRILGMIEEERAAGTITTREEALELARRQP